MVSRRAIRLAFALLLVAAAGMLAVSYTAASEDATVKAAASGETDRIAEPRENVTVVTTHAQTWVESERSTPLSGLIAIAPNGSVQYFNNSLDRYFDVDPVAGERATVEYVAAEHLPASQCPINKRCPLNVIERVNLTTGATERVYAYRGDKQVGANRWHDVDRINESHVVVADIANDRVLIIDVTSGEIVYEWNAEDHFGPETGGPEDNWTHLNDVEWLADGRIMASPRNQDRVIFITPGEGVDADWTLGEEDEYSILYEQHNPDYIPEENGGPAVIVADSSNARLVEYQRVEGTWERSWRWQDARMSWPRDADRLPNGHTLVADSHGDRVFEIAQNGSVVWSVPIQIPYDAERLGTGDESAGGPSAHSAGIESRVDTSGTLWNQITGLVPNKLLDIVLYLLPQWLDKGDIIPVIVLFGSAGSWVLAEVWWRRKRLPRPWQRLAG
jgi:hypothetical protein